MILFVAIMAKKDGRPNFNTTDSWQTIQANQKYKIFIGNDEPKILCLNSKHTMSSNF